MAAEFLDDLGIFTCGDALHIFLLRSAPPYGAARGWLSPFCRSSQRKGESPLTAHSNARKLAVLMLTLWQKQAEYEPLRNAVRLEAETQAQAAA
jgi:hypothetical protein